jgi:hypothetical protein
MRHLGWIFNHSALTMVVAATALAGLTCSDFTTSTPSSGPRDIGRSGWA